MNTKNFLWKVPILASLPPDCLELLASKFSQNHYFRGEIVFHQGDTSDRLHIIAQGLIKISIISVEGREQSIAIIPPFQCFGEMGLLDGLPRSATATAMVETTTCTLSQEDFRWLQLQSSEVAGEIAALVSKRSRNLIDTLGNIAFLDVPTRVAKALLLLSEIYVSDLDGSTSIEVPLSHAELACFVDTERETVTRALGDFRRQGILTTGHGHITITDSLTLENVAAQS